MDFEKYTDRARGFVQSAQSLALREGHQQFATEHLLKVLLDDPEGLAAGLIDRSGGRSREALAAVEAALAQRPKVSGAGAGQVYLDAALARVFDQAQKIAEKAGDSFVTVERLLLALALEKDSEAGKILSRAGVTPQNLNAAIEALEAAAGGKYLAQHFAGETEPGTSTLRTMLSDIGAPILDHDPALGGRYSVFSTGIVPALLAGLDPQAFRDGARETLDAAMPAAMCTPLLRR